MQKNSTLVFQILGLMTAALLLAAAISAQSLGELARQARAKKGAPAKATRVYDNDSLPREGGLSTTAVEADPKAKEKAKEGEKGEKGKEKEGEAKKSPAEEEKAYREKAAKLRDTLAYEEKKLDVLQREFNLASVQFYSNPDQALREQTMRTELNNRQAEIEKQKAAVGGAKKAIADLEEELRRRGLPPGWAR